MSNKSKPGFFFLIIFTTLSLVSVLAEDDPDKYTRIDNYALSASPTDEKTLESLARYLEAGARSEEEKVRAAFRWTAERIAYESDLEKARPNQLPEVVLRRRLAICEGYTRLLNALVGLMGIASERVGGWNQQVTLNDKPNHAWSAIRIDGTWRLLDATYARKTNHGEPFSPRWFCVEPEIFINTNYPTDPRWQLLDPPISKEEYAVMVKPFPTFYKYKFKRESLSFRTNRVTMNEPATFTMEGPENINMMARLYSLDGGKEVLIDFSTFVRREGQRYEILVEPPVAGTYRLDISGLLTGMSGSYNYLLQYNLDVGEGATGADGFPHSFPGFMGRGGQIVTPLSGNLHLNSDVAFAIAIPWTEKAAVLVSGKRIPLVKESDGLFKGTIRTPAQPGTIEVQEQPEGAKYWNRLLIYNCR